MQGSYQEEILRVEMFFDTVRSRISDMQAQVTSSEKKWAVFNVPWDSFAFKVCRSSSLHIATLCMSRYWQPKLSLPLILNKTVIICICQ